MNFPSCETSDWIYSDMEQNKHFKNRMNDLVTASLGPSKRWKQNRWNSNGVEYYDDQWGNIWFRMEDGCMCGEIYKPALERWSNIETLSIPDYDDASRYEDAHKRFQASADKFKIGVIPGWVFDTSRHMRKMEIYLCDLIDHREEVDRLNTIISELLIKAIGRYAEIGADAIVFYEDMGTQTSLLISPPMWRDVFKSHYARLVSAAHERGLKVFMHSCGQNWELVDDLIKVGIDCFNFDQPAAYTMEALAAKLRESKVGLWSPIDIQRYLPTGDKELIQKEARRMIDLFQGNLILKSYSDLPGIGVKYEWEQWGYDALAQYIKEKYGQKQ
jgi:uroporphyrinogen decarboxylase